MLRFREGLPFLFLFTALMEIHVATFSALVLGFVFFLSGEAIVRFPTCKGWCRFLPFLPPDKAFIDSFWTELGGSDKW